jgi:hypothetical protein
MRLINLIVLLLIFGSPLCATDISVHDWDDGNGTIWSSKPTGLSWQTDVLENGSNHHGWRGASGYSSYYPRFMEKSDYTGVDITAEIDTTRRAPSTSSGGCLFLSELETATSHQICWWFIYLNRWADLGYSDVNTNRMEVYAYFSMNTSNFTAPDAPGSNVHIGTYLCADGYCIPDGGDSEEPGNRHYYHYLGVYPGAWIKINLAPHPEHLRDPGPDPVLPVDNYFQDLNRFYIEICYGQTAETYMLLDEMNTYATTESENDISIGTLWVGYWSGEDLWRMSWQDVSFEDYNNDSVSTFEVRWSTSPITNANFNSATIIEPLCNEYGTTNQVRRPNSWRRICNVTFNLPDETEASTSKIYFAIKDVSATANGDGHDAPSNLIRTIEYDLAGTDSASGPVNTASGTASWR